MLPHGGHARFVDEVVETGDDALVCVGRIPVESSFAPNGVAPGFVLIELAAQAAAIEILARMHGRGPRSRVGFLARGHGLNWTVRGVPAGVPLRASVRRVDSIPPLYLYSATVTLDGVEVFGGEFSIFVEDDAAG